LAALIAEHEPQVVLMGAGPEGRDLAGALSALTGLGVLANARRALWEADGPVATHSVFGGKLITESALTGGRGVITVRPNSVTAEPAATAGGGAPRGAPRSRGGGRDGPSRSPRPGPWTGRRCRSWSASRPRARRSRSTTPGSSWPAGGGAAGRTASARSSAM